MFNKKLCCFISLLTIAAFNASAQTTLNFQNPKQAPAPNQAIPPSDFASQVKAVNAENHTKFTQELAQQKNALANPKIPSLSEVQSMSQTPPPAFTAESEETQPAQTKKQTQNKQPEASELPPPSYDNTGVNQPMPSAPPPTVNTAPPPKPTQTQPYTGFGAPTQPSSSTNANTPQQKSGNGFNIQY